VNLRYDQNNSSNLLLFFHKSKAGIISTESLNAMIFGIKKEEVLSSPQLKPIHHMSSHSTVCVYRRSDRFV